MTPEQTHAYLQVLERELRDANARVLRVELTLGTLVQWMAQSANSPVRPEEARQLLALLGPQSVGT